MANNQLKGIVIEIGGNTAPLEKALRSVNDETRKTESELKKVERLLKFNPESTELIAQKQQLLAQAISATSEKLDVLKKSQEKVEKAHAANEEWERQFKPLGEAIDATSKKLKELSAQEEKVSKAFESGSIDQITYDSFQKELCDVREESKKLMQAKRDLDAQFADGHINDEQYRGFQREMISTTAELERNKAALEKMGEAALAFEAATRKSAEATRQFQQEMQLLNAKHDTAVSMLGKDATVTQRLTLDRETLSKQIVLQCEETERLEEEVERLTKAEGENSDTVKRKTLELEQSKKQLQNYKNDLKETEKSLSGNSEATRQFQQEMQLLNAKHDAAVAKLGKEASVTKKLTLEKKVLNKQVALQREETSRLKAEVDRITKAEGENSEAAKKANLAWQQSRKVLLNLNNDLNEVEKGLSGNSAAFKEFGNKVTEMGEKMKPISTAAAGVAGGMVAMAVKAGQSADDLNTLSKQTGLSTQELQKFKYATDIIDVPLETLTGSMSKLTKNMAAAQKGTGDAAKAFKTLKVDITDGHGALRDNEEVFNDTISALGKVTNETERDAMAMQIFGKSAQDLNPLILGGADALKQLGDEAEASGLILPQETLDRANEFNDSIDTIKATTMGTLLEVGSTLAEALMPAIEALTSALKNGATWLRSLDADTLNMIVTIALVVAALAPALILIGQISTGLGSLSGALAFLAANPIVLLIAAIALLVAGFIYLWNTSEEFRDFFIGMGEDISGAFLAVGDFFVGLFTEKIPGALQTMQNFFKGVFDALADIAKKPINAIIGLLNGAIEGINFLIGGINSLTIDMPDWIPEWLGGGQTLTLFSIPEIPTIPLLAKGGVLSEGQAIVAEAGPEMIQMLGGKAVVTPLSSGAKNTPIPDIPQSIQQFINITVQGIQQLDEIVNWYTHRRQIARATGEGVV